MSGLTTLSPELLSPELMAVVVGGSVILFDPIFQGLAISLMAGEIESLLISRIALPVIYYLWMRHDHADLQTDADRACPPARASRAFAAA